MPYTEIICRKKRHLWSRCCHLPMLVALLLAQMPTQAETQSELQLWVVKATTENREKPLYDKGLEAIERVLAPLPHDTYRKVRSGKYPLGNNGPNRIPLTKAYTLEASAPVSTADGRSRLKIRILMKKTDNPAKEIAAVSTELLLLPKKQVLVRGLKQKDGSELVLVLALSAP